MLPDLDRTLCPATCVLHQPEAPSSGASENLSVADFLRRLAEKEHEHGIAYDRDVDAFLQACTVEGKASHPLTNFFLRILGLEVSRQLMWGGLPARTRVAAVSHLPVLWRACVA